MRGSRALSFGFVLAMIVALGSLAVAQDRTRLPLRDTIGLRQQALGDVIQPTQEQRNQIRSKRQSYKPQLRQASQNVRQAHLDLREALMAPEASQASIAPFVEKVIAAQSELIRLRSEMNLELNQVLTSEQRIKIKEFREKVKALNKQHKEERRALMKEFTKSPSK